MSKEILINIESFQTALNSIQSINENMNSIKTNITDANSNLKNSWKGKSSKAFFKESDNIASTFTDYSEGLNVLYGDLNTVLSSFIEEDSTISESFNGGS